MFERLSDDGRSVMVLALQEGQLLSHPYLGTEHLLLGLIREDRGKAAKALDAVGVQLNPARRVVESLVGTGVQPPFGHLPFTPNAEGVLGLSTRIADMFGAREIDSDHLLLAVIGVPESSAMRTLRGLNVDLNVLRVLLGGAATLGELDSAQRAPLGECHP
jgi:ATP-dependent Clp protease ATP-binding subunit ClpC